MTTQELNLKITSFLKVDKFSNLPYIYQLSIIIRAFEVNENIEWSYTGKVNWIKDASKIKQLVLDYQNEYPSRKFSYGLVPTKFIIERVMLSPDIAIYGTFKKYHEKYGDPGLNSNIILPLLVSDTEEEFIEDGWHRFHLYINKGYESIPIVKY